MNGALSQETSPTPPEMPAVSKEITPEEAPALQKYSTEMTAYYETVAKTGNRVSAICDRFQSDALGLDATEVDVAATDFGDRCVSLSTRRQQLAVNFAAFLSAQRSALSGGRLSRFAPKLAAAAIAALISPTSAGDNAGSFEPTAEERSEMDSQARSVQQSIAQLRSDSAACAAARGELVSTLKAKYPGNDWSFLAAK